jgi:spore coat protein CotH
MMQQQMELVAKFDKDGDKRLNAEERKAAREYVQKERAAGRGPGGFGGGRGGFGPGMVVAPQMAAQADKDGDQKVTKQELAALADAWFDKLDPDRAGKLDAEQLTDRLGGLLQTSAGPGGPGGRRGRGGGAGGVGFFAPGLFVAFDADRDGSLTRPELKSSFEKWAGEWDADRSGALNEDEIRQGLTAVMPQPNFGGPGGLGGGRGGPGGPGGFGGFGGRVENEVPVSPGPKVTVAEVKTYPDSSLYDPQVLRTLFLDFEGPDWEKELADFKNTDVEVPAKLTVDGKSYDQVGVHFRGMSSFGMIGEGRKRSMNVALDFAHDDQDLYGYRTLNLLNAHEDPTFIRAALYYRIAREYIPTPKVNLVRLVINGESWGVYINAQQFNKDLIKEWFGTSKGARWKVQGSPGGRGGLSYLGENIEAYKRLYTIKSKDDPQAWADLVALTKTLNETPADKLEEALSPRLNIDGALKFLALENVLVNNDGYWIRSSDYNMYQDEKGRFHIIPHDTNETFGRPGGPGFGGGGQGGGGPGGAGGAFFGGASRGALAEQLLADADGNKDQKLTREELEGLADRWLAKLDPEKSGKLGAEDFQKRLADVLSPEQGAAFGAGLFSATDTDKDGTLTSAELKGTFGKWAERWDTEGRGGLNQQDLGDGLRSILPRGDAFAFRGPPGGPGGEPGPGGPGGRGGPPTQGLALDPLIAAGDQQKPLLSKLLAVPALRERYLAYVREIAEKWLDWQRLGPIAEDYYSLIAEEVKRDTRKLDSTEAFEKGLTGESQGGGGFRGEKISIRSFARERREYILGYREPKTAAKEPRK